MSILLEYVKEQCLENGTVAVYDFYLDRVNDEMMKVLSSKGSFSGNTDVTPEMKIYGEAIEIVKKLEKEGYKYHV